METLEYKGVEFEIDYEYDKGQKEICYPTDDAQEGIPAHCIINDIEYNGVSFLDVLENDIEEIEEILFKQLNDI